MRRTPWMVTLVTVGALASVLPEGAHAQAAPGSAYSEAVDGRNPWTAGILEGLLPTLGYNYADSWSDGIVPGIVRLGGAVAMFWGLTETLSREPGDPDAGTGCTKKCSWGFAVMTLGTAWGVVGAVSAAKNWSGGTPEGGVATAMVQGQRGFSVSFRIAF